MFNSLKLMVQYCHANGIFEVAMDLAPSILKTLEYRVILNILKFLIINSDLNIIIIVTLDNKERFQEVLEQFHSSPLGGHQGHIA